MYFKKIEYYLEINLFYETLIFIMLCILISLGLEQLREGDNDPI